MLVITLGGGNTRAVSVSPNFTGKQYLLKNRFKVLYCRTWDWHCFFFFGAIVYKYCDSVKAKEKSPLSRSCTVKQAVQTSTAVWCHNQTITKPNRIEIVLIFKYISYIGIIGIRTHTRNVKYGTFKRWKITLHHTQVNSSHLTLEKARHKIRQISQSGLVSCKNSHVANLSAGAGGSTGAVTAVGGTMGWMISAICNKNATAEN